MRPCRQYPIIYNASCSLLIGSRTRITRIRNYEQLGKLRKMTGFHSTDLQGEMKHVLFADELLFLRRSVGRGRQGQHAKVRMSISRGANDLMIADISQTELEKFTTRRGSLRNENFNVSLHKLIVEIVANGTPIENIVSSQTTQQQLSTSISMLINVQPNRQHAVSSQIPSLFKAAKRSAFPETRARRLI